MQSTIEQIEHQKTRAWAYRERIDGLERVRRDSNYSHILGIGTGIGIYNIMTDNVLEGIGLCLIAVGLETLKEIKYRREIKDAQTTHRKIIENIGGHLPLHPIATRTGTTEIFP